MTLKLVLDKYEEGFAVCLDFEDTRYLIPKEILGEMKVNDIFNIDFDGTSFSNPVFLKKETEEKKESVAQRMKKLYNMNRHRRPPKL